VSSPPTDPFGPPHAVSRRVVMIRETRMKDADFMVI